MAKRKPTGFVAICPDCKVNTGAMDFAMTGAKEASKILGEWLANGMIVEPRFTGSWNVYIDVCKCNEIMGGRE